MTGYQKSLSNGISIQGTGWESKFSVSQEFKDVKESINRYHKTYVETVAQCILYLAELKQGIKVFNMGESFMSKFLMSHQKWGFMLTKFSWDINVESQEGYLGRQIST